MASRDKQSFDPKCRINDKLQYFYSVTLYGALHVYLLHFIWLIVTTEIRMNLIPFHKFKMYSARGSSSKGKEVGNWGFQSGPSVDVGYLQFYITFLRFLNIICKLCGNSCNAIKYFISVYLYYFCSPTKLCFITLINVEILRGLAYSTGLFRFFH